ncbi:putative calponin-1-like [Triplophysa rosa]|uniref:Calponin-1-like n=1 Tax=Triplophysa rosa TaxID=992332 RepID=A0A9W7WZ18_TRIRA|nr:putative calponin-1-like [Triplophysa rosa]
MCSFGSLTAACLELAQKYDPQTEDAQRMWIYEVTGRAIPDNFMEGLKDGVLLCE